MLRSLLSRGRFTSILSARTLTFFTRSPRSEAAIAGSVEAKSAPLFQGLKAPWGKKGDTPKTTKNELEIYDGPLAPNLGQVKQWCYKATNVGRDASEKISGKLVEYVGPSRRSDEGEERPHKEGFIHREITKIIKEVLQKMITVVFKVVMVYELGRMLPLMAERKLVQRYKRQILRGMKKA